MSLPITVIEQRCAKCETVKSAEHFAHSGSNPSGLHSYCKTCMSDYMRAHRAGLRVQHLPRTCEWCPVVFIPKDVRKRFCSSKCKGAAGHAREQAEAIAARTGKTCAAPGCDNDISRRRSDTKWCSDTCSRRQLPPELRRKYRLFSKYGITPRRYDEMVLEQGGLCAICRGDDPKTTHGFWHIDHCHDTCRIRGLLCSTCNTGLGSFFDNADWLIRAAAYVTNTE